MKFASNYPDGVVYEINYLLDHPDELNKRSEIGRVRMGDKGAAERIASYVYQHYIKETSGRKVYETSFNFDNINYVDFIIMLG